ncbi:gamma carbonic anhydrase family protein [Blastopirellula retiformator]|uniref:2,3,4,5-tetrahydropyridine-2,6-dicarboxylate N-acetyltransferase n=1 Tax=Blastopirellula retiformator TaxID=2527970 RepID=A0A5C5V042_9BACT|nr:gamma carbonic anhydrase family protein [Blastopirellula retiformator]TWT31459.1 2,3,4,5-tetrahydropyridine-2,6-dicarboxylate N-acetyltransferase [Blastopirellula retiformator]
MTRRLDLAFHDHLVAATSWIAPTATVIGNVTLGEESIVLYSAVVRGDNERIEIGASCNVQDGAVLHADPGFPCVLADRVSVGHRAIVHGAMVEEDVLIGMGAILLNGAKIGAASLIAAGALVTENTVIPPRSVVMGVPGKVVRQTTEEDLARIRHAAEHYRLAVAQYLEAYEG